MPAIIYIAATDGFPLTHSRICFNATDGFALSLLMDFLFLGLIDFLFP
jgi:hypothetical protein